MTHEPVIRISRKLANQLLHLAQLSPDSEICGFLGGRNGLPVTCYPVKNIAKKPEQQFLFDPAEQIAAIKKMRAENESLFAIYHSHPSAPATPSQKDLDLAAYPDAYYLIVSLSTKGVLVMKAFKLNCNMATEIPILLYE